MTHPLNSSELHQTRSTGKPVACVNVMREGATLVIQPIIGVLKADVLVAPLPDRLRVTDSDGEVIKPSKGKMFYITIETFDPCHAVSEL